MRKVASIIPCAAVAVLVVASTARAAPVQYRSIGADRVINFRTATVVRWAEQGNSTYQTNLGYMYETGQGVPQDYRLAAIWYHRAAEQGNVRGQHLLGLLYDRGQGVTLDHVEAHKWLNLAASRAGRNDGDYFIRIRNAVASKLTHDQIYEAQRRAREWRPRRER
jgi:hypothetical protein